MKDKEKCFNCNKDITNELPKIDVNSNHYCGDCYINKCKTELKEKQIEEMAEIISNTEFVDLDGDTFRVCEFLDRASTEDIARELLKHYQPKLPEDSFVLSVQEYLNTVTRITEEFEYVYKDKIVLSKEEYEKLLEQRRKARSEKKRFKRKYLYLKKDYNKAVKETAEKILNELYVQFSADYLVGLRNKYKSNDNVDLIKRYAKQFDVEIKEN